MLKKIFIIVLFFVVSVSAIQFSPTQLEFNVQQRERLCQKIFVQPETETHISDVWAENTGVDWKLSDFDAVSEELGVTAEYPSDINEANKEVEICITASKNGTYRGAIVFRQEKIGSSIIQYAVWLKVNVEKRENASEEIPQENTSSSTSSRSSRGRNNYGYSPVEQLGAKRGNGFDAQINNEKLILGERAVRTDEFDKDVFILLSTLAILISALVILFFIPKKKKKL